MITSPTWRGKRYAVLGLARSGVATVRALVASGAEVVAWDSNEVARAAVSGARIANPEEIDLAGFDGLVVSPGVPINRHPVAAKARAAGVPIIGDIELFAQARASLPAHKVVGITGTNGKSTTTALIHHLLETAGMPARLGGNIGKPVLGEEPLPEGGVYVLELSSYQIDLTTSLDCDVAILLNITPDHLDRYDGFERLCRVQGSAVRDAVAGACRDHRHRRCRLGRDRTVAVGTGRASDEDRAGHVHGSVALAVTAGAAQCAERACCNRCVQGARRR